MKIFDLLDNVHRGNSRDRNREFVRGKLVNYRLYGYLCEYVDENNLNNYLKRLIKLNKDDKWALFKIMAVGDKEYNKKSPENTSFAYGDVAVLVSNNTPINDWYQIEGNVRTVLYDGTGDECYVCNMRKSDGKWCIEQPFFDNLDLNLVSEDINNHIIQSENTGVFTQPAIPRGMFPVKCIDGYEGVFKKNTVNIPEPTMNTQVETVANTPVTNEQTANSQQNFGVDDEDFSGVNEVPTNKVDEKTEEVSQTPKNKQIELKGLGENGSLITEAQNTDKLTFGRGLIEFDKIPAKNIDWSEVRYREHVVKPIENRKNKLPKTEKFEILGEVSEYATSVREDVFSRLLEEYDAVASDIHRKDVDEFNKLLSAIRINNNRKPQGVGTSGNALMKHYIKKQKSSDMACTQGSLYDTLVMNGTERLTEFMKRRVNLEGEKINLNLPQTDEVAEVIDQMFPCDIHSIYAGLYASLLGLSVEDYIAIGNKCRNVGLSFIKIVAENPYLLMLIDEDIKFLDLEVMANARGLRSRSVETWRLVCILHDMLNNLRGSTAFDIYELAKNRVSYSIGKRGLAKIRSFNSILNNEQKANIQTYIDSSLTDSAFEYVAEDFNSYGVAELSQEQLQRAIIAYVNAGLGVTYKGILYNTSMLREDIDIYNSIWSKSKIDRNVDMSLVDTAIELFEQKKSDELGFDFKLEKEQRDACYMVNQTVLCVTGPAGSGKTTTVEAMIFVRSYCNKKKDECIVYAAPTGKAANRLQEVVKQPVRTQHSMFKIFSNATTEIEDYLEDEANTTYADIYVFDEQAMAGTKLMSRVLKGLKKKSSVFLIGDIEQLVPIERGKPFADFLSFLPTVRLRVSKRSLEGSDLSKNISNIIDNSERKNFKPLTSGSDTALIDCKQEMMVEHIRNVVNYHLGYEVDERLDTDFINSLGKLSPDDIQIASPVVSERYSWGCSKLNVMLQDIFNPSKGINTPEISFGFGENMTTLRLGSRVIHVNNNYGLRHYSSIKPGNTLVLKDKAGVMNGDVGTIVAIGRGEDFSEIGSAEKVYNNRPVDDNSPYFNMDFAIVVVKYKDSEDMEDYYVVYRAPIDLYASLGNKIVCRVPGKLGEIQLAYALSIHKLQGSEAKLIIFTCGNGLKLGDFLNRNLVYTAVSRAKRGLYVVGNMGIIEKAREFSAIKLRRSAMEEFV